MRIAFVTLLFWSDAASGQLLIGEGQVWSYQILPRDSDWTKTDFDDADWSQGLAPLGFGDPKPATIIYERPASGRVPVTTAFRTGFNVDDVATLTRLAIKVRVDDGCSIFLNGREIRRVNLPEGILGPETFAVTRIELDAEHRYQQFECPSGLLKNGNNVLCVEVHQAGTISSDLFLDLSLIGVQRGDPGQAYVDETARQVTATFSNHHRIDAATEIPDGFLDGGRGMQVDEFGFAVSSREILKVDRSVDVQLRAHLAYAASKELAKLNTIDRATRIARYIDRLLTPNAGRGECERLSGRLVSQLRSREVLLGDVKDFCLAGVCRHRSLLFKLMADAAGLEASLVRGNYGTSQNFGGHSWNELTLDDGKTAVVDVMNPQPDFYFPVVGEPSLRRYLTVSNVPKYAAHEND